jgi:hypothetical protein
MHFLLNEVGACGSMVDALHYKMEGHGFDSDEITDLSTELILPATL